MPEAQVFGLDYYLKAGLAGGLCCGITHAAVCPLDVVKTRIQLDPTKYNRGMLSAFRTVVSEEGVAALGTGLGATAVGYFIQGWFKFGGVEVFKTRAAAHYGPAKAWEKRTAIYLGSAACAEFIADCFLCPLEACRIRAVSDPTFGKNLMEVGKRLLSQEGVVRGFYSGFGPILFKQIPYTMAKFAVQGDAAERIYKQLGSTPKEMSPSGNLGVALTSGVIAGVAAATISHPADTLLSLMNKKGEGGEGSIPSRMINVTKQMGIVKLCTTGLGARWAMIGSLTALQFGIFDTVMYTLGAKKFHFTDPNAKE